MIHHLDHLVLTTVDADACIDFYTRVLGMRLETFAGGRQALRFGQQKINIHRRGHNTSRRRICRCPARSTCASSPIGHSCR